MFRFNPYKNVFDVIRSFTELDVRYYTKTEVDDLIDIENTWDRNAGTSTLSPHVANDNIDLGTGTIISPTVADHPHQNVNSVASPNFIGIGLFDFTDENYLRLISDIGSLGASDRILEINVNDANRTLTITGNPTIADWFDQSVKTGASPTFAQIIDNGLTASLGVYTTAGKQLTSTPPSSGVLGYWSRAGTTLSQSNVNDDLNLGSGNLITTGNVSASTMFSDLYSSASGDGDMIWDIGSGLVEFKIFDVSILILSLFGLSANFNDLIVQTTGNININSDSSKMLFGISSDVSINFNGADMIINSENITANDEIHFTNFDKYTFDETVEVATKIKLTAIGGYAIKLTNKTGNNSVAGQIVIAHITQDDAVALSGANELMPIGVFLDGGVVDGSEAWIVISGIADVAYDNSSAIVRGDRITTGLAGLAMQNNTPSTAVHFREIGHAIESVAASGTARVVLHFL